MTICVVDTGVTPTPDLDITARYAFDGGTLDDVTAKPGEPGHGTTVAHFAAAAVNGWGGAGIFPYARIASVRVFPERGGAAWQDYIKSFDRCERLDPMTRVIVMSLGAQSIAPDEAEELQNRITRAQIRDDRNVVVSAGNSGASPDFPGRFPRAFTVAGADENGALCAFSARGSEVDVLAPACGLVGTGWSGERMIFDGTSFGAPIVAGLLAAVRSYRPDLDWATAEQLVRQAAADNRLVVDVAETFRAAGLTNLSRSDLIPGATSLRQADSDRVIDDSSIRGRPRASGRPVIRARWRRPFLRMTVHGAGRVDRIEVKVGERTVARRGTNLTVRLARTPPRWVLVRLRGVRKPRGWTRIPVWK